MESAVAGLFSGIFFDLGLTSWDFGCILYDIGSIWGRCSPQKRQRSEGSAGCDVGAEPKKNRKIFGKAFDKAEKCAIVYITRLIRS